MKDGRREIIWSLITNWTALWFSSIGSSVSEVARRVHSKHFARGAWIGKWGAEAIVDDEYVRWFFISKWMCLNILDPKIPLWELLSFRKLPQDFRLPLGSHMASPQLRHLLMRRNWWCYKRWKTLCGVPWNLQRFPNIQEISESFRQSFLEIEKNQNPCIHFLVERWDCFFLTNVFGLKMPLWGPVGQTISL